MVEACGAMSPTGLGLCGATTYTACPTCNRQYCVVHGRGVGYFLEAGVSVPHSCRICTNEQAVERQSRVQEWVAAQKAQLLQIKDPVERLVLASACVGSSADEYSEDYGELLLVSPDILMSDRRLIWIEAPWDSNIVGRWFANTATARGLPTDATVRVSNKPPTPRAIARQRKQRLLGGKPIGHPMAAWRLPEGASAKGASGPDGTANGSPLSAYILSNGLVVTSEGWNTAISLRGLRAVYRLLIRMA